MLEAYPCDSRHEWSRYVGGIEPTAHPVPVYDVMREDVPGTSLSQAAVLQNAPDQAQQQIRVPKVIADA